MSDISDMSEEFHDWLEQCPCVWVQKYGENTYTFIEAPVGRWVSEENKENKK